MTWVIGIANLGWAAMLGDIRLSQGTPEGPKPWMDFGLKKIYLFSPRTAVGLAGTVCDALTALDSLQVFLASRDENDDLLDQLKEWKEHVGSHEPKIARQKDEGTSLLVLRSYLTHVGSTPLLKARLCQIDLPAIRTGAHIGVSEQPLANAQWACRHQTRAA
jgi:hypothetical protein